jgi:hypothetical protein
VVSVLDVVNYLYMSFDHFSVTVKEFSKAMNTPDDLTALFTSCRADMSPD